jgi:hypothetical protein
MKRGSAARARADGETKDVHGVVLLPLRAVPVGISHLEETLATQGAARRSWRGRTRARRAPAGHAGRGAAVADIMRSWLAPRGRVWHLALKKTKERKSNNFFPDERTSSVREVLKRNVPY